MFNLFQQPVKIDGLTYTQFVWTKTVKLSKQVYIGWYKSEFRLTHDGKLLERHYYTLGTGKKLDFWHIVAENVTVDQIKEGNVHPLLTKDVLNGMKLIDNYGFGRRKIYTSKNNKSWY